MPRRDRVTGVAILALLAAALLPSACRHLERNPASRPPLELPPEQVLPYRPRHPGFGLVLQPADDRGTYHESFTFHFAAFSEDHGDFRRVEGRFYRSRAIAPGTRGPLILIAPILAGAADNYLACRVFARWACEAGISAIYLHQDENILASGRDGVELERLLRGSIQDDVRALDLFLARPDVDPARLGSLGISMGALRNVVLIAVEPRLAGNVLCLGGAGLPDIFRASKERRVVRYIERRGALEGLSREEVARDIERSVLAEPSRFAPAIANDRVLLFLGRFDNKVPFVTGLRLWEELGGPEIYILPFGHYTGIAAAPFAAFKAFRYFRRRFGMHEADE